MADFRETLMIRCTDKLIGSYMMTWAKYDLAQSETEPIESENEQYLTLGEACKRIDRFCDDSLSGRKLHIRAFLEKDEFTHSEEY